MIIQLHLLDKKEGERKKNKEKENEAGRRRNEKRGRRGTNVRRSRREGRRGRSEVFLCLLSIHVKRFSLGIMNLKKYTVPAIRLSENTLRASSIKILQAENGAMPAK